MTLMSTAKFLETLAQSQLLEPDQKEEVARNQARFGDARGLAQDLLRRDWLTPYQVNQLLQGRVADLTLGQFILLERLGEGGMGQVFKARQRNLNRIVALKVIRPEFLNNNKAKLRFQREMRATGQLAHPNIVHAFDADQIGGYYYIAMEYIEGVDLSRLVKQQGPLLVAQACDYIRQAALGLQHAHERGLIHRDIKPANLLVTRPTEKSSAPGAAPRPTSGLILRPNTGGGPWGTVKLLDLGLARWNDPDTGASLANLTQLGSLMGTPDFIAPEQARNSHTSDIRADLYSLGCTFYFLLAGRAPFPNGAITEKLLQHQLDDPDPLDHARRQRLLGGPALKGQGQGTELLAVPTEVQTIVRKLMAKKPEDRFQTPGELAIALENYLAHPASPKSLAQPAIGPTLLEINTPQEAQVDALAPTTILPMAMPLASPLSGSPAGPLATARRSFFASRSRRWKAGAALAGALFIGMTAAAFTGRGDRPQAGALPPPPDKKTLVVEKKPPTEKKAPPLTQDEKDWQQLVQEVRAKKTDPAELRQKIVHFRKDHYASPLAVKAAQLLTQVPSPLDALERGKIDKRLVYAWQPEAVVGILGIPKLMPDNRAMSTVAFSPDGALLAAGNEDALLRVVDLNTMSIGHRVVGHTGKLTNLAYSPDGQLLASAGQDGVAKIWNTKNLNPILSLEKQSHPLTGLAFHPSGAFLAVACADGKVRLYECGAFKLKKTYTGNDGPVHSVTFTPDGKFMFWSGENGLMRWAETDGPLVRDQVLHGFLGPMRSLAFSPDGMTLAAAGANGVTRLCAWNGKALSERALNQVHKGMVHGLAFAPDGHGFVTVGEDTFVRWWNITTGKPEKAWEMRWPVRGVAFAPDGRHFATANGNNTVFIFRSNVPVVDTLARDTPR